jgi:hypothetical protein
MKALIIWWASVPAPVRDLVEGALSAAVGAGVGALEGIDWANPALTPKVIGMTVGAAVFSAVIAYGRHRFTAPAAAIESGSVTTSAAVAAATAPTATPPPTP